MNSTNEIEQLIASYAASIDRADTNLAKQIWSAAPQVTSYIHGVKSEDAIKLLPRSMKA
jgi:hypothetical protein